MQSQSQRLQIKKLQGTGQNKTPLILSLSKGLMVSLSNHEPRTTHDHTANQRLAVLLSDSNIPG